jgi:hypothetical protein
VQGRSFIRQWDLVEHNLMINGYRGVWAYDRDDDSQFVIDRWVAVYSGARSN